jgi:hypothetical protein
MRLLSLSIGLAFLAGCTEQILTGTIAIKGSEPHTYPALTTADQQEYRLVGQRGQEIGESYQNMLLKVRVRLVKEAIGPDFPAEVEVLEILEIKKPVK